MKFLPTALKLFGLLVIIGGTIFFAQTADRVEEMMTMIQTPLPFNLDNNFALTPAPIDVTPFRAAARAGIFGACLYGAFLVYDIIKSRLKESSG